MRLHITLEDEIVGELDRRVSVRGRSAFISAAVRRALEDAWRWEQVEQALGVVDAAGHEWDDDPSAWVRAQRSADRHRVG
jgi:metal-responsive CopG/Arc/MetJ family transcriptional regulator